MSGYPRAREEGIISEDVDDELVVYDQVTQTAHALSRDAAAVWGRCDGRSSAKDIAWRLGLEEARVAQALGELSGAGLIEGSEGISRRALYKRAAKLGAAAVSAPLIYSIAVPAASAAQSPASACGSDLGQVCSIFWDNDDCSGDPAEDECALFAGAGCTCQNLTGCQNIAIMVSRRVGTCG